MPEGLCGWAVRVVQAGGLLRGHVDTHMPRTAGGRTRPNDKAQRSRRGLCCPTAAADRQLGGGSLHTSRASRMASPAVSCSRHARSAFISSSNINTKLPLKVELSALRDGVSPAAVDVVLMRLMRTPRTHRASNTRFEALKLESDTFGASNHPFGWILVSRYPDIGSYSLVVDTIFACTRYHFCSGWV